MALELFDGADKLMGRLENLDAHLRDYNVMNGMRIHVCYQRVRAGFAADDLVGYWHERWSKRIDRSLVCREV